MQNPMEETSRLPFQSVKKRSSVEKKGRNVDKFDEDRVERIFLHWSDPPEMPAMETMDEEEGSVLKKRWTLIMNAQSFREQPRHYTKKAVVWFSGEVEAHARKTQ
jgi:hypothetical protein